MDGHRADKDAETISTEVGLKRRIDAKGTSFLEDTCGLHKGQFPIEGRQLFFQLCYSLLLKYNDSFRPIHRNSISDIESYQLGISEPIILTVCFIPSLRDPCLLRVCVYVIHSLNSVIH